MKDRSPKSAKGSSQVPVRPEVPVTPSSPSPFPAYTPHPTPPSHPEASMRVPSHVLVEYAILCGRHEAIEAAQRQLFIQYAKGQMTEWEYEEELEALEREELHVLITMQDYAIQHHLVGVV